MASCRSMTCCIIFSIIAAIVVVLLAAISFPVANSYMRKEITKRTVLVNGSQLYENWKDPTLPIYVQVFIFDLLNPKEVQLGEKPNVTQKGPFTYREHKIKVDIEHYDDGTLSYREISSYFFDREKSSDSENINITSVNIPLLGILDIIQHANLNLLEQWVVKLFLDYMGDADIFMTRSVKQIVWGYEEPILKFVKKFKHDHPKFHFLPNITSDLVGVLGGKNNTDDGVYRIYTGVNNISLLGVIEKYNGKSNLNFWTTDQANMINGTDGTLCPPFIVSKDLVLEIFNTDICRSIDAKFQYKTTTPQGIELFSYAVPKEAFEKPSINPNNIGFCTPAGNCMGTGVLNVSTCHKVNGLSLPIVVSNPHFFMAEEKYQKAVIGIDPNLPNLATVIDLEPHTGLVMQAAKRLQINVFMKNSSIVDSMNKVPTMVFPLLWVNESIAIDNKTAHQFKSDLLNPLTVLMVLQVIMFGIGAVLVLLAALLAVIWLYRNKGSKDNEPTQTLINEED